MSYLLNVRIIISLALLSATCSSGLSASVEQFPKFDVDRVCAGYGVRNIIGINACIDRNQAGYDFLMAAWPSIPDDVVATCSKSFKENASHVHAYDLWADCVSSWMKLESLKQNSTVRRKFEP